MSMKHFWKAVTAFVIKRCRLGNVATDVSERLPAVLFSAGHTVVTPTTIIDRRVENICPTYRIVHL
jgi:hypothetical protein